MLEYGGEGPMTVVGGGGGGGGVQIGISHMDIQQCTCIKKWWKAITLYMYM